MEETVELNYYEVDIEYTSQAKMILRGKDENEITDILNNDFPDVPNLRVLSIVEASPELVEEAKARRAFADAEAQLHKEQLN